MTNKDLKCEVCDVGEPVGVAAMSIGAMSIRYCKECLEQGAEPKWAVQWLLEDVGYDNLIEEAKQLKYYENGEYKGVECL